jgi:drug/metabolite transporter (DMT)-like permease
MRRWGPWLVALGAGLWGTENIWRVPLSRSYPDVAIVFWEHALLVLMFTPVLLGGLGAIKKISPRAWAYLVVSGAAGSAVGTVFYTAALAKGNATVVSVVVSVQPLFSTVGAVLLLGDRISPRFWPWAALALGAGLLLSLDHPSLLFHDLRTGAFEAGTGYALLTAAFWGLATVAGRAVMVEVPLAIASGLRLCVGLACMTAIVLAKLHTIPHMPAFAPMLKLVTIAGALPLLVYFTGLKHTRASTAGWFEQVQTIVAAFVGWVWFDGKITLLQLGAAAALIVAVTMVQVEQGRLETESPDPAAP